jgi:type IV pilus assembly protein PilA
MLILGILAAIALPAFFNQKEKAGDAKAKENAHTAQVALETWSTDHSGSYLNATVAELKKVEPTIVESPAAGKAGIELNPAPTGNTYTIVSTSSNGHTFDIVNNAGTMTYPCAPAEKGGCPSTLKWGE